MTFRPLVLALCAASLGFAQAPVDWRFAQPDSDMRMSMNLQSILKSQLVMSALKQAQQSETPEQAAQMQFVLGMLGSIDRVSVSAKQIPPKPGAPVPVTAGPSAASAAASSDALVLVSGSFDTKMVQSLFPSTGTSHVEPVGPHTILIGDGDTFTKALQRMSGDAPAAMHDDLEQSDIWLTGNTAMMSGPTAQMSLPGFKELKAFSLGVNLQDSPELNVNLTAATPEGAAQIMAGLHGLMAVAGAAPQAAALEQLLQFKQDGPRVRMHMVVPPEMLKMAQGMASSGSMSDQLQPLLGILGLGSPASANKGTQAAAPPAAAPAPKGDIVIYGLEGGPKVVKPQ